MLWVIFVLKLCKEAPIPYTAFVHFLFMSQSLLAPPYVCMYVPLTVCLQIDVTLTITDQQDHCPFLTINPLSVTRNEGDNEGDIGVSITATDRDSTGTIASLELLPSDSPFQLANVAGLSTSTVVSSIL